MLLCVACRQAPPAAPVEQAVAPPAPQPAHVDTPAHPSVDSTLEWLRELPAGRRKLNLVAHSGWDTGVTQRMEEASHDLIVELKRWVRILDPAQSADLDDRIQRLIAKAFERHNEDNGGGTICGPLALSDAIDHLDQQIELLAASLARDRADFDIAAWRRDYAAARHAGDEAE